MPCSKLDAPLLEPVCDILYSGGTAHYHRVSGASVEESRQQLSRVVLNALEGDVGERFDKLPIEGGVRFSHVGLDALKNDDFRADFF